MPEDKPIEPTAPPSEGPIVPRCPWCHLDPCIPEMVHVTHGTLIGKIFFCPNRECRAVFNTELIGRTEPTIVAPRRPA